MNLTEELERLDERQRRDEDAVYDPMFMRKMAIWREVARRIEALEETVEERGMIIKELLNPRGY